MIFTFLRFTPIIYFQLLASYIIKYNVHFHQRAAINIISAINSPTFADWTTSLTTQPIITIGEEKTGHQQASQGVRSKRACKVVQRRSSRCFRQAGSCLDQVKGEASSLLSVRFQNYKVKYDCANLAALVPTGKAGRTYRPYSQWALLMENKTGIEVV